jgi:hypothetical protein
MGAGVGEVLDAVLPRWWLAGGAVEGERQLSSPRDARACASAFRLSAEELASHGTAGWVF